MKTFQLLNKQKIESLSLEYQEYEHKNTGAKHIHLASDNKENVFMVAFRTIPEDSTGVAHILEHTVLCGSKKFPVRDPFFSMLKRSMNTFMNAFTSSDWTAYPFASQNQKDFDNLLSVYLDSVFFPNLNELDFAQEGHRLEFSELHNRKSELVNKGIVFNEMKGAMSSVNSILWQTITKNLFSNTTYHFNSGGEPEEIVKLTYEHFKNFHETHYHPSNAIFFTFGDISAFHHQEVFERNALAHFNKMNERIAVNAEARFHDPKYVKESFPATDKNLKNNTHIVMAWLLGNSVDIKENLKARLISNILLDNSGSPLLKALETTPLANSPSPMCGLEDSMKEMCFVCGVEGSESKHTQEVEKLILETLQTTANKGVSNEQIIASLDQIELSQREITGSSYPYGLQLILSCMSGAIHRGDPKELLDIESALTDLRKEIQSPNFLKDTIEKLFIQNNHRVILTLQPDSSLLQNKVNKEKNKLRQIKASISDKEADRIIEIATKLQKRQSLEEDLSVLPKLELSDIPDKYSLKSKKAKVDGPVPIINYDAATNGIVYQNIVIPIPTLTSEELTILPLYTALVTEVGVGDINYEETQLWQSRIVGSFEASMLVRSSLSNTNNLNANLILSTKGLKRHQREINELIYSTLEGAKFSEIKRVEELLNQIKSAKESAIIGSGHLIAMTAASKSISASGKLKEIWSGIESLTTVKNTLANSLEDNFGELCIKLKSIHTKFMSQARQILLVCEQRDMIEFTENIKNHALGEHQFDLSSGKIELDLESSHRSSCYTTNTQVNFCARSYETVSSGHPDAPILSVLGGILRNGYLHQAIREIGGAYGGGASQDSDSGAFRFFSYRDPRLSETLNDFDEAIAWIKSKPATEQMIEEAILGVVSSLDKPKSPSGEAKEAFFLELNGRNEQTVNEFRNRVLKVCSKDIDRVANKYLTSENCHTAIITNELKTNELDFDHVEAI